MANSCGLNLARVFKAFQELRNVSVPNEQETKFIKGLVTISEAFKNAVNPNMIKKGFACCGQHVESHNSGCTISFERIMKQCKTEIGKDQLILMKEKSPHFAEIIRARGRLT